MRTEIEKSFFVNELLRRLLPDLSLGWRRGLERRRFILEINDPLYLSMAQEYLQQILESQSSVEKILSLEFNPNNDSIFVLSSHDNQSPHKEHYVLSFDDSSDPENAINAIRQWDKGSSLVGQYLSLDSLIPQILPQATPIRFAKIVYQPESDSQKNQSISLANAMVWTSPGMISGIEYMISLLRLSQCHPSIFLSLAPMLRQRIEYLFRQEEQTTSLSSFLLDLESIGHFVFKNTLTLLSISLPSLALNFNQKIWFRRIFTELCRMFLEMKNPMTATLLLIKVLKLHTSDEELYVALARSALVLKDQRLADAAFVHVLEMNPSHHEGRVYLQSNPQMASPDDLAMMMEKYLHTTTISLRHQSSLTMNGNVVQYFTQPLATGERFLEESVRLSSSVIWELQKVFYQQNGLQAWSDSQSRRTQEMVPYYLTSNPYFAREYAKLTLASLMDLQLSGKISFAHPIYILDIGCGNGQFALLFIRYLNSFIQSVYSMEKISPRMIYVALDVTDNSFETWCEETTMVMPQSHREMYLSANASIDEIFPPEVCDQDQYIWLDFALFDAEKDTKINLSRAMVEISETKQSANPIFVFGNYLFDSLTADAFTLNIQDQGEARHWELSETLLSLRSSCPLAHTDKEKSLLHSSEIRNCTHEWTHHRIAEVNASQLEIGKDDSAGIPTTSYSHHDTFDRLLASLVSQLLPLGSMSTTFTLPIGGLRCLERMRQLSSPNLLISFLADKAYHSPEILCGSPPPIIASHGSISLTVNFVCLEKFSELHFGCASITSPQAVPLDIAICCLGIDKLGLPSLHQTFDFGFNSIHVYDLFVIRDHIEDSCSAVPPSVVYHLLNIGAWDSDLLLQFERYLLSQLCLESKSESLSLVDVTVFRAILERKEQLLHSCLSRTDNLQRVEAFLRIVEASSE